MNVDRSEWGTFVLGPYSGAIAESTFPCLPQVKTGRKKILPRPANIGPPDPNVDDTLSNVSWEDLSAGQGIAVINPASDSNRFWYGTSDTRYTDGWTLPPEIVSDTPSGGPWVACIPLGRIGESIYGMWTEDYSVWEIHVYDPDAQTWASTGDLVLELVLSEEAFAAFRGRLFIPQGTSGYIVLAEISPGVLSVLSLGAGTTPVYTTPLPNPPPTDNPAALLFAVYQQQLWAITIQGEEYQLAASTTGGSATWFWPVNTAIKDYIKLDTGIVPYQLITFPDQQGLPALWLSTNKGLLIYDTVNMTWVESLMWNVPPHPDFGRSAAVFRPGEAIWVASGGGDLMKMTSNGVVAPASGPGGNGEGLPEARRGSVWSMATDLANLYLLLAKRATASTYNLTLVAGTGKGWHPLWDIDGVTTTSTYASTQVAYATLADGITDYRLFWSVGSAMYSMPLRLETYSSRQGREAGIDRFGTSSTIELGEFNGGSLAIEKLASHCAIILDDCPTGCSVTLEYQTEVDPADTWTSLGTATTTSAHARHVFPFGLSGDDLWSDGLPFYWIKLKLTLAGPGGTSTPIVRALTLSYMPLPQDAATLTFTIPLPVSTDKDTDLTAEQIRDRLEGYVTSREFIQLTWQDKTYRVYCASVTASAIGPKDATGSMSLVAIQINTGDTTLRGEVG